MNMKSIINIFSLIVLTIILSSCFTSLDDVSKAKEEILSWKIDSESTSKWDKTTTTPIEDEWDKYEENMKKFEEAEKQNQKKEKYSTRYLTDEKFISLDDLEDVDFSDMKVEITWKTLISNVDKIIVNFSNIESPYPEDNYQLWKFKAWDETFLYRAFEEYKTLDEWINTYVIEAYSWDAVSKLELKLNNFDDEEMNDTQEETIIEDINIDSLPVSEIYWNPVSLWSWKYTYNWIKWLEISNVWDIDLENKWDSVTSYVIDKFDGWPFWNTLRNIKDDKWISFYVLRLDGDNYLYEKHYYTETWIYWIITLEEWTWVTVEGLWEKNKELKNKNEDFVITTISDILFKQILN